jgi:hypothetical protein
MTKKEDKEAISNLIIGLAKANNWKSREDLKEKTGKPIKTINQYLNKYIFNLIENKGFIEKRHRRTGEADTLVKKYKLKSDLDNLLAVFEYLNDRKYQKELMETDYYKSLIPKIKVKVKADFRFNRSRFDTKLFKYHKVRRVIDAALNNSPTAVNFLLKVNNDILEKAQAEVQKLIKDASYKRLDTFIWSLSGFTLHDMVDNIITQKDYPKF